MVGWFDVRLVTTLVLVVRTHHSCQSWNAESRINPRKPLAKPRQSQSPTQTQVREGHGDWENDDLNHNNDTSIQTWGSWEPPQMTKPSWTRSHSAESWFRTPGTLPLPLQDLEIQVLLSLFSCLKSQWKMHSLWRNNWLLPQESQGFLILRAVNTGGIYGTFTRL